MGCKKACLVINPRDGQNLAKITDIIAVLAAAGWATDVAIKEYPGHTMELATTAAKKGYDLVIAYGGDGTLNQVVNGALHGKKSAVGTIPGGTVNEWAAEVNIPSDPVKATLTLVNSEIRKVDVGHVEVEGLTFPTATQETSQTNTQSNGKKANKKKSRGSSNAKRHFLLMAGLGIDAAVMGHVNKTLKHKIGVAAVGLTVAKELPSQHAFPVEIRATGSEPEAAMLWRGEALQVVVGNTRRYADMVEMTPNAYVDDGVLDVCVITAGNPLTTMGQVMALFLRRKPDNLTAEYFRGAHLLITVPASIDLHVDGSTVKLKDYLSKSERKALEEAQDAEHVMVTYRFDAVPHALQAAIPRNYDNALFEEASHSADKSQESPQQQAVEDSSHNGSNGGKSQNQLSKDTSRHNGKHSGDTRTAPPELVNALLEDGRKVTVVGVGPNPAKQDTYIVAGRTTKRMTGDTIPVAVCIDGATTIVKRTGEHVPPAAVQAVQEGQEIVVEGKKSKRGVIHATRALIGD